MKTKQKTFFINLGFVIFAAFFVGIIKAAQTGAFDLASVVAECVGVVVLAGVIIFFILIFKAKK